MVVDGVFLLLLFLYTRNLLKKFYFHDWTIFKNKTAKILNFLKKRFFVTKAIYDQEK